jgi:hypothetical protein
VFVASSRGLALRTRTALMTGVYDIRREFPIAIAA